MTTSQIAKASVADGGWVVEAIVNGELAWLVEPIPLELYTFTFDPSKAHIFPDLYVARNTGSSVQVGYFQSRANTVFIRKFDGEYRALVASNRRALTKEYQIAFKPALLESQ